MANQTIPRHAAFFKERRDLRQEARALNNYMRSLVPQNMQQAAQMMEYYLRITRQLVFWGVLLVDDEQQQGNPFARLNRN